MSPTAVYKEQFKGIEFPTRRMEAWKYLDLEPVLGTAFETLKEASAPDWALISPFSLPGVEQIRVVLINGRYSAEFSDVRGLPEGVVLRNMTRRDLPAAVKSELNPFAAINTAKFEGGVFLYIPDKVIIERPIHVLSVAAAGETPFVFYPRIYVSAGASTRLKFILNQPGFGGAGYLSNTVSEFYLAPGACVKFHQIQRPTKAGILFSFSRFYLKRHGDLEALTFTRGGLIARNEHEVFFEDEHGFASLNGLGVLDGASQLFNHLTVHHDAPHCISRQFYKNILAGRARAEYNSLVHAARNASGTDSRQLNKNLLLSDTAQAYPRPQLKIDTDDVSCTHGATVGQMEESELFYLRSRGLSEAFSRFLLTYGFAEEVIESVEPQALRAELEELISEGLKDIAPK